MDHKIPFESHLESGNPMLFEPIRDERKKQQFEAVKRWFFDDWQRIEPELAPPLSKASRSSSPYSMTTPT
jgi:hypothetical protein